KIIIIFSNRSVIDPNSGKSFSGFSAASLRPESQRDCKEKRHHRNHSPYILSSFDFPQHIISEKSKYAQIHYEKDSVIKRIGMSSVHKSIQRRLHVPETCVSHPGTAGFFSQLFLKDF